MESINNFSVCVADFQKKIGTSKNLAQDAQDFCKEILSLQEKIREDIIQKFEEMTYSMNLCRDAFFTVKDTLNDIEMYAPDAIMRERIRALLEKIKFLKLDSNNNYEYNDTNEFDGKSMYHRL